MNRPIRGLFLLEPPSGGLERLRQAIHRDGYKARWQTVMPWTATACLVLVITAPLVVEPLRALRARHQAADQIVASARALDPQPLTVLPSERADVRVYLAVPTTGETTSE